MQRRSSCDWRKVVCGSLISRPCPRPPSTLAPVLLGDTVYVAGGLESPDSTATAASFWSLDLSKLEAGADWQTHESWPGPSRMLAVAGAQDESVFVFGGIHLADGNGDSEYTYLQTPIATRRRNGQQNVGSLALTFPFRGRRRLRPRQLLVNPI